jgi:hypothetical protein
MIDLHDAVLDEVRFDWKLARLEMLFSAGIGRVVLTAESATSVNIPCRMPWGPSSQVNTVTVGPSGGVMQIEIEMQSGDTLQVQAKSVVIARADAA